MDVTNLARSPGLDDRQLARLEALERSTRITGGQSGEARFYAHAGTPEQRARAERVVARGEQLAADITQRQEAERLKQTPISQSMDDAAELARQMQEQRGLTVHRPNTLKGSKK